MVTNARVFKRFQYFVCSLARCVASLRQGSTIGSTLGSTIGSPNVLGLGSGRQGAVVAVMWTVLMFSGQSRPGCTRPGWADQYFGGLAFHNALWAQEAPVAADAADAAGADDLKSAADARAADARAADARAADIRAAKAEATDVPAAARDEDLRSAYLIDVPLPLLGSRDEVIQRQIEQIANKSRGQAQRPIVVLRFAAQAAVGDQSEGAGSQTRGSQFERGLSLARFLTSPAAAKVRLVAYLPGTVEGHAVLPVLACEEIIASSTAELGRASVDESMVDDTVRSAYKDIAKRRGTLSEAAVLAMLDPNVAVIRVELASGDTRIVTDSEAKDLRDRSQVIREESLWSGGGLAAFTGQRMRQLRWVAHVADGEDEIAAALNIRGRLQPVRLLPEKWIAARVEITQDLDAQRVNQIIRSIDERRADQSINLLIVQLNNVEATFDDALRLALYLANLDSDGVVTAATIEQSTASPALLAAFACDQVFAFDSVVLGSPDRKGGAAAGMSAGERSSLLELETLTARPASLMVAAFDPDAEVQLYVDQVNGKRVPMSLWQVDMQETPTRWLAQERLAGGGEIDMELALRYQLVDSIVVDDAAMLSQLGLTEEPTTVELPWLESVIERVLAREWLPRLLVIVGFMALMIEMGSPGLGFGGFAAALCFAGFFWIEGLNGNLAWLEVLLFVGGMCALAIELFVIPGFGLFGIGGLLMVLASIVLASQTFVFPSNSEQLAIIANNLFWVALCALMVMIGAVAMGNRLESTPILRWVTIQPAGTDDLAELEQRESVVHWEHLLGQDGLTTTRLNPSGKAQFGRLVVNVLGTDMIAEGVAVRVVEVRGNSVFVEPLES